MKSYVGVGYTVYMHENLTNGKVYIGQTKREDLTRRWAGGCGYKESPHFSRAIKKYGWGGFSHKILETGLTKEQADVKERFYIALYNSTDKRYGYNVQYGGSTDGCLSEEGRKSIIKHSSGANAAVAKKVDLYDSEGRLIKTFDTLTEAAKYIGCNGSTLSLACRGKRKTVKGYLCHPHTETKGKPQLPAEEIFKPNDQSKRFKPVAQYDLQGNLLNVFPSVKAAAALTGSTRTEISVCINDKNRITANRFMWRKGENPPKKIEPCVYKNAIEDIDVKCKAVLQIDPSTIEVIAEYPSITEASRAVGAAKTNVSQAIKRHGKCKGFLWELKYA